MNHAPTSACVVLFNPSSGLILAERHARGWSLPGGRRESTDSSSFECAARELREETGAVLHAARSVLTYQAGPYFCEAFQAIRATNLPTQEEAAERNARWVEPEALVHSSARFPAYCARLFARIASQQSLGETYRYDTPLDWSALHAARSTPGHIDAMTAALELVNRGRGAVLELKHHAEVTNNGVSGSQKMVITLVIRPEPAT